jgi:hypothetical protein
MTDPSIRTKATLLQDDQRWIGNGGVPIGTPRSIVLDRSGFDLVTTFPNGFIPSGVTLAKVAATGLYVPYAGSPAEVQTLTFDATGGTYTVAFDGSPATANVTYANTSGDTATLLAALESLSTINPGDVTVTRGTPVGNVTVFTVTFAGRYVGQNVPLIAVTEALTGGSGTLVPATGTGGGPAAETGTGIARGHLFAVAPYDRDSTGDISAALFWSGEVDESFLPTSHGLDAAAKAALTHIAYV